MVLRTDVRENARAPRHARQYNYRLVLCVARLGPGEDTSRIAAFHGHGRSLACPAVQRQAPADLARALAHADQSPVPGSLRLERQIVALPIVRHAESQSPP